MPSRSVSSLVLGISMRTVGHAGVSLPLEILRQSLYSDTCPNESVKSNSGGILMDARV